MIHTLYNCIIFSQDPTLIGMLAMNWHQIHYIYDLAHLIENANRSHPDAIVLDCRGSNLPSSDILQILSLNCKVFLCADTMPQIPEEREQYVQYIPTNIENKEIVSMINAFHGTNEKNGTSNRKILIVEDNNDIRDMYVLSFKSRGYTTYEANDGLAGIAKAAEIKPGIVVLDIMMPHMDGFEVLHTLKNNTSIRPIIIVNSNLEWVDEERKIRELGADYFLRKSQYTPLEVVQFIEDNIFRKELI